MGEAKRRRKTSVGPDHGPIEPEFRDLMNYIAGVLDDAFNGKDCPADQKRVGFFLATFKFDEQPEAGRFNYISNANKLDVRAMLKEIVARIEARMQHGGEA